MAPNGLTNYIGVEQKVGEKLMNIKENVEMDDFMNAEDFKEYKELVEKFLTKINSY